MKIETTVKELRQGVKLTSTKGDEVRWESTGHLRAVSHYVLVCILTFSIGCDRKASTERPIPVSARDASMQAVQDSATSPSTAALADASQPDAAEKAQAINQERDIAWGIQAVEVENDEDSNMSQRRPAEDLAKQIKESAGSSQAPSGGARSGRVIVTSHSALDQSSLSSSRVVTEFLRRDLASVKKCYASALSKDARAHGEMKLRFAVSETGTLLDGVVESWDPELSSCVRESMPKWSFPIPKSSGNPIRSRFELDLDMKSE